MADENTFALALRFEVTLDGHDLGAWSKCSGLSMQFDVVKFQQGASPDTTYLPGRSNFESIKLTRGLTPKSKDLVKWLSDQAQKGPQPGPLHIVVKDATGAEVTHYDYREAMPSKYTGPTLDANSTQVATEELELVSQGFMD